MHGVVQRHPSKPLAMSIPNTAKALKTQVAHIKPLKVA